MPTFLYRVARSDGTTLDGQIESESEGVARAQLEGQGLLVFQLRRKGDWSSRSSASTRSQGKIPIQDFLIYNQELLALIKAGLPILRVCDLLIERTRHAGFRAALELVRQDIRGGASASDAFSRHPTHFPELYIASIRAGEQAGNLPEVLQRYIQHLKLMVGLRQKIIKATAYPAVLLVLTVLIMVFLLLFVVPVFIEIYEGRRDLPFATQVLITVVGTIQNYLLPASLTLVGLALAFWIWNKTQVGREITDRVLLRVPLLGELLQKHHTIQFSRTLATVLGGGTPMVEALRIARGSLSNRFLSAGVAQTISLIRDGAALAPSLEKHRVVPRLALEMLAVGEETGSLEMMLREVGEFYEGEMNFRLEQLTTVVEIGLIVLLGILIGTVVIVMYLPIFQMGEVI